MQILCCTGPLTSTHENHHVDIRLVMADKMELMIKLRLSPVNDLNPLIKRIASSAVFDADAFHFR